MSDCTYPRKAVADRLERGRGRQVEWQVYGIEKRNRRSEGVAGRDDIRGLVQRHRLLYRSKDIRGRPNNQ
jgi:hypothetical protein